MAATIEPEDWREGEPIPEGFVSYWDEDEGREKIRKRIEMHDRRGSEIVPDEVAEAVVRLNALTVHQDSGILDIQMPDLTISGVSHGIRAGYPPRDVKRWRFTE